MSSPCRCCGAACDVLIDLGRHPVSTRFVRLGEDLEGEARHPLSLVQCPGCGLIQLAESFPVEALVPLRPVVYREPEGHLDDLADSIRTLAPAAVAGRVFGLTAKDDTLVKRFADCGAAATWRPSPGEMGATAPLANIETIQSTFTPAIAESLAARQGRADLLLARHILEHCDDPLAFLSGCRTLLAPEGLLVIEVPDCAKSLDLCDYTTIWEEHIGYFTPHTAASLMMAAGFSILDQRLYPCPYEDLIVIVARADAAGRSIPAQPSELARGRAFAEGFCMWTARLSGWAEEQKRQGRRMALFGAGHLTSAFVNYHGLEQYFEAAIDDTDWKQGCGLPGTAIPVVPSSHLAAMAKGLCLMGVSPTSEAGICARLAAFEAAGGSFLSLLADSPRTMRSGQGVADLGGGPAP